LGKGDQATKTAKNSISSNSGSINNNNININQTGSINKF